MNLSRLWPYLVVISLLLSIPGFTVADIADLEGNWLQLRSEGQEFQLTAEGEIAVANYVPLRDDPDLQCKPASLTNVIAIPDPPFAIRLHDDFVEMNFEYMDVQRRIPIDARLRAGDAPYTVADFPHLGRSSGRFENDSLVIDTVGVENGFLHTLRDPYPQSTQMRTEERYSAAGDRLRVEILHTDPVMYREPFVLSFEFLRVDFEILEFGCELDAANYDDRL